jgi:hypothetical protein
MHACNDCTRHAHVGDSALRTPAPAPAPPPPPHTRQPTAPPHLWHYAAASEYEGCVRHQQRLARDHRRTQLLLLLRCGCCTICCWCCCWQGAQLGVCARKAAQQVMEGVLRVGLWCCLHEACHQHTVKALSTQLRLPQFLQQSVGAQHTVRVDAEQSKSTSACCVLSDVDAGHTSLSSARYTTGTGLLLAEALAAAPWCRVTARMRCSTASSAAAMSGAACGAWRLAAAHKRSGAASCCPGGY